MPAVFRKEFEGVAGAILTEAIVIPSVNITEGQPAPLGYYTDGAVWDTGAEMSIISADVVSSLGLEPIDMGTVAGIGGDYEAKAYRVHLALPNGYVMRDITVYCGDLEDYDVIIGMDVMCHTDFCVTNTRRTVFTLRAPATGEFF